MLKAVSRSWNFRKVAKHPKANRRRSNRLICEAMMIDMTVFEPDGLQVHIRLNALLSEMGFFKNMTPLQKQKFDDDFEHIISDYLPYEEAWLPAV